MSNHSGSYMLNEVLRKAKEMGVLEQIGKEKTIEFTLALVEIGGSYDCNDGEILDGISEELGICYYCMKPSDDLKHGLCKDCRDNDEE